MNLLAAETVDSEAIQQVASNGGGIPLIAIVLVILALLVVLAILASVLSSKKKAETRPVSQQDQKKQEKIKREKEMKKQKHEEKRFMEKPSGLPEDNVIGKKVKKDKVVEPVVKEPVVAEKPEVVEEPVVKEPVVAEEPVVAAEPAEPAVDENREEFDAINAMVINGVCSARSYEPGDKITFRFNYGLATELNVAILPELLSLTDKIANVKAEAYNGTTITVQADCLAPFAVKTLQAKPIVDKASVLNGKPKVTLKIYLEQVVR